MSKLNKGSKSNSNNNQDDDDSADEDIHNNNNNNSISSSTSSSSSSSSGGGGGGCGISGGAGEASGGFNNNNYSSTARATSASNPTPTNNSNNNNNNNNSSGNSSLINRDQQTTAVNNNKASSSHRLSSIEILNENRQRQLQFKQQESFKSHIEQRQKLIQQQQRESNDDSNLGVTYQVNTSAPDFMASALAKTTGSNTGSGGRGNSQQHNRSTKLLSDGEKATSASTINPFDEEKNSVAGILKRPTSAQGDKKPTSTVSGKSGFLSALMDEASFESNQLDRSQEELNNSKSNESNKATTTTKATRYANVTAVGGYSYDDENPDKRPFYQKDFATLLQECRASRKLVIAIVAIALLLDNMLLTSVVPIIPFDLLKNRMEKKHADLIQKQNQFPVNNSLIGQQTKGRNNNRDGDDDDNDDDDDDEDEQIAKYIEKSIANAKDRYSGSVFHPRVKIKPNKLNKDDDDGDDDDEDDDMGDKQEVNFKKANKLTKNKINSNEMRKMQSSGRQSSNDDDDDDDYEEIQKEKPSSNKGNSKNKQDDDGDDEDLVNSQRWTKLKSSLISMARTVGNDTDVLADRCLNMVLGSGSLVNKDKDDEDDDDDGKKQNVVMANVGNRKNENDGQMKSQSKKDNKQKRLKKRSPKVNRPPKLIKPQPSTTTTTTTTTTTSNPNADSSSDANKGDNKIDDMTSVSHQDIVDESFEVGVMFASKPIVQAFANPFIGTLTNKVGFTIPMFTGFVIMFISTLVFAFGSSYSTLFIARAIQGVGSACTSVAGMSMLADRFPDDAERGNAMAIALGGLALGVVIGPPFGGFMYEFVGRSSPFIVLSFLALLDGLLQLLVLQPRVTKSQEDGASLMTLIKDPYILVAAGAITFANTGIAILEPALPLWMMDTMQAKNWEQGVAFLPAALSYMFGTNLFGNLGHKIGRWRSTMIGLIIIGCSLLLIPFATRVEHLIIPNGAIGFAMGMVDSTMMPMLGYLVDIRHTSVYGSVYAIGDVAFCASFAFGPALSGTLVELIGFEGLIITTAFICFSFAPLLLLLKNPPARQLNEAQLQEQSTLRYVNYNHLDSPDEEAHLTDYKHSTSVDNKTYVR